jgi:hypothetical protein
MTEGSAFFKRVSRKPMELYLQMVNTAGPRS